MSEHTPTPWLQDHQYIHTTNASGPVPIATGHYTYVTDRAGALHQEACANAAFIVKAVNSHDALVKALEAALADITETAQIHCNQHDRKTKTYIFNDDLWKAKSPGSFAVALQARAALAGAVGLPGRPL